MRSWKVQEPTGDYIMTEKEIIDSYFPWWTKQMRLAQKDESMITLESCLKDWITVHWASECP